MVAGLQILLQVKLLLVHT